MLDFVNQKIINNKTYIAYRNSENPSQTFIECDGVQVEADLNEIWNSDKLTSLFNGS